MAVPAGLEGPSYQRQGSDVALVPNMFNADVWFFFGNEVDTQADVGERRSWSCLRERTRATLGDKEEVEGAKRGAALDEGQGTLLVADVTQRALGATF